MDFKLKIFVYLDDLLPTPEAILLIRQVFFAESCFCGHHARYFSGLAASPVYHIHVSRRNHSSGR